ncbi:MAG TPA: hypothetical protein PKH92_11135, partial [Anaerolineaceae bacterium]|nr:hypothetical protein [Anaerolineaceae bacterium]
CAYSMGSSGSRSYFQHSSIERFWRHLKDRACANKLQDTIVAVMDSVEQALLEQNRSEQISGFRVSKNL